jgi:hypothetical protein
MTIWSGKLNQPVGWGTKVAPLQKPQPHYAERLENSLVLGLEMATRYVQDVSEQTDRVIESSRKHVLRGENVA